VTSALDVAGLFLLGASLGVAVVTGARGRSVEDRIPGAAPLQLEKAVGPGDE
jgi:hypothetical protein